MIQNIFLAAVYHHESHLNEDNCVMVRTKLVKSLGSTLHIASSVFSH